LAAGAPSATDATSASNATSDEGSNVVKKVCSVGQGQGHATIFAASASAATLEKGAGAAISTARTSIAGDCVARAAVPGLESAADHRDDGVAARIGDIS
jgi:hypothetical protein